MRSVETVTSIGRKLRYAQIGGGRDSFIGAIHRRAAALDGFVELTAGALSSTGDKALASARDLLLPPEGSYASWQELVEGERARPAEERIDFVSIVTPNHVHFEPARACVEAGFHVVIDKPMVHDSTQAERLARAVAEHGTVFAVTYNYTGYPMVKEARHWIEQGRIGAIRRVVVEYAQGWLSHPIDAEGHKQAAWRTDPARAGIAGALGDIGTHCENLVSYVTGLAIRELSADLATFVPGRRLDDDVSVLLRFASGGCELRRRGPARRALGVSGGRRREEPPHPAGLRHRRRAAAGIRKTLTACCTWTPRATPPSPALATPDCVRRPSAPPTCSPVRRRGSWAPSPTSTLTRPTPCAPVCPGGSRPRWSWTSLASPTAPAGCGSWSGWSRTPPAPRSGRHSDTKPRPRAALPFARGRH